MFRLLSLLFFLLFSGQYAFSQTVDVAGFEIEYRVFNTNFLTPQVAETYDIVRAKNRALINITVRKKLPDGGSEVVSAKVRGTSFDLLRKTPLKFFEVQEGTSRYYLAELKFHHSETLYFNINVQTDPDKPGHDLEFSKTFYTN